MMLNNLTLKVNIAYRKRHFKAKKEKAELF